MSTGAFHVDCGAPVVVDGPELRDPDGAGHLCRDYLAWHRPADPRHPDEMPWPVVPRSGVIGDTVAVVLGEVA